MNNYIKMRYKQRANYILIKKTRINFQKEFNRIFKKGFKRILKAGILSPLSNMLMKLTNNKLKE